MTDNEIIKALKIRLREGGCNGDCPLLELGYCFDCACVPDEVARDVLDLINRKDKEIEKLNVELVGMRGACESYKMHYDNAQAEIERLQKLQNPTKTSGFRIENGKVIYYSDMLNGYRHEYKDLGEIVKELNLYMHTDYKNIELISHYKHKAQTAKSEAIKEFSNELIKTLKYALYGLDIKEKTISKEEVQKRFELLMHKDIPEVIEYVKNKMVGDEK